MNATEFYKDLPNHNPLFSGLGGEQWQLVVKAMDAFSKHRLAEELEGIFNAGFDEGYSSSRKSGGKP